MKSVTEQLLKLMSNWTGSFSGAYNVREDGARWAAVYRQYQNRVKVGREARP